MHQPVQNGLANFLSLGLKLVIEAGLVTSENMFEIVAPNQLAKWLERYADERSAILTTASGIHRNIGLQMTASTTSELLSVALNSTPATDVDPTMRIAERIRSSISYDSWAEIIPVNIMWSIIFSGSWITIPGVGGHRALLEMLDAIDRLGLLTPSEKLSAITPSGLDAELPERLRSNLLTLALTDGLTGRPLDPKTVFQQVQNSVIISSTVEPAKAVLKKVEQKYRLLPSEDPAVAGKTLTPPGIFKPPQDEHPDYADNDPEHGSMP